MGRRKRSAPPRRHITDIEKQELAERTVKILQEIGGQLSASLWVLNLAVKNSGKMDCSHAVAYLCRLGDGSAMLALRKFEDVWQALIPMLMAKRDRPKEGEALVKDCKFRGVRDVTNQIVAHYSSDNGEWPLTLTERTALIERNGWDSVEDLRDWLESAIIKVGKVSGELQKCYTVKG